MRKQLVLLLFLALLGMVVDAYLQHRPTAYCLLGVAIILACLSLLPRRSDEQPRLKYTLKPSHCASCGYDLAADHRNTAYCPQCGSSQSQDAHLRRRKELMLELERLQLELVRNHRMASRSRK